MQSYILIHPCPSPFPFPSLAWVRVLCGLVRARVCVCGSDCIYILCLCLCLDRVLVIIDGVDGRVGRCYPSTRGQTGTPMIGPPRGNLPVVCLFCFVLFCFITNPHARTCMHARRLSHTRILRGRMLCVSRPADAEALMETLMLCVCVCACACPRACVCRTACADDSSVLALVKDLDMQIKWNAVKKQKPFEMLQESLLILNERSPLCVCACWRRWGGRGSS